MPSPCGDPMLKDGNDHLLSQAAGIHKKSDEVHCEHETKSQKGQCLSGSRSSTSDIVLLDLKPKLGEKMTYMSAVYSRAEPDLRTLESDGKAGCFSESIYNEMRVINRLERSIDSSSLKSETTTADLELGMGSIHQYNFMGAHDNEGEDSLKSLEHQLEATKRAEESARMAAEAHAQAAKHLERTLLEARQRLIARG